MVEAETTNPIQFLAWSNSETDPRVRMLLDSAAKQDVRVRTIPCFGLAEKPTSLLHAIETLPDDRIVVCTDGFDVLYLGGEKKIRHLYLQFESPVVFGGEVAPVHHFNESETIMTERNGQSPYPFLNSGLIIGTASELKMMLRHIVNLDRNSAGQLFAKQNDQRFRGHFNDQTLFGRYAVENPQTVKIDTNGILFWNASRECQTFAERFTCVDGVVENRSVKTRPAFLHIPYLNRYYPTYLWVARQLGLPPASKRFCVEYWENSLEENMVPVDPKIRSAVDRLPKYRLIRARRLFRCWWSRFRIAAGRVRRQLLGMELPE